MAQYGCILSLVSGYPWYPALIFNPELGQEEPLLHGDEELPQPTPDIISLGENLNKNPENEHNLVLFFDARRTWLAARLPL